MAKGTHKAGQVVAALDVGSSCITCVLARLDGRGGMEILAAAQQASAGVRGGLITDMAQAQGAIKRAVHAAETKAAQALGGYPLRDVIMAAPALYTQTLHTSGRVEVAGRQVGRADAMRALAAAQKGALSTLPAGGCELIHTIPAGYSLDGHGGIADPVGLSGRKLTAEVDLVLAESGPLHSLTGAVEYAHLTIAGLCIGPYAAGLACLALDEADLGATVLDLGGGTTSMAVFIGAEMVYCSAFALGSGHISSDIAKGLTTSRAEAERIKVLYGNAMAGQFDTGEMIDVPILGEEGQGDTPGETRKVARSVLIGIIQPRVEEIFEAVRARLTDMGVPQGRIVLTGGGSQLAGMRELAQHVLDRPVRLGRPIRPQGLPEVASNPSMSVATGLLTYLITKKQETPAAIAEGAEDVRGTVARAWTWFKENW